MACEEDQRQQRGHLCDVRRDDDVELVLKSLLRIAKVPEDSRRTEQPDKLGEPEEPNDLQQLRRVWGQTPTYVWPGNVVLTSSNIWFFCCCQLKYLP